MKRAALGFVPQTINSGALTPPRERRRSPHQAGHAVLLLAMGLVAAALAFGIIG